MKKSLKWLFVLILTLLTPIVVCYVSYQMIAFDETFYTDSFTKFKVYERLPNVDIEQINTEVMQFLQDDSIEEITSSFFSTNERSHLKDVQTLIHKIDYFALTCIAIFLLTSIATLLLLGNPSALLRGLLSGSILTLVLIGLLGLIATIDFMGAFTVFHVIFFPQGNYSFNPAVEKIVVLYPPALFFDATIAIVIRIIIGTLVIGILSFIGLKVLKSKAAAQQSN